MTQSSSPGQTGRPPGQGDGAWARTPSLEALRRLTAIAEQVPASVARRAGLSHNELRALDLLAEEPRGPAELARALGVTSAAASGIIDRLEERGHATRAAHSSDGRRTSVTISGTGREEVTSYLMPMFRELARLDAELSPEEREVVARYLDGAARAMRAIL